MRGGDDAFGFSKPRLHPPREVAQRTFAFGRGFRGHPQRGGDAAGHAPGFRLEHAAATNHALQRLSMTSSQALLLYANRAAPNFFYTMI